MVDVLQQLDGKLLGRGHVIDQGGVDGAAGHAVELGRGGVLHHHHAELLLDGPHAQGAVAPHPGKNHADRLLLLVRGQVAEEEINGRPQAPGATGSSTWSRPCRMARSALGGIT